jgi:hypothetical protein
MADPFRGGLDEALQRLSTDPVFRAAVETDPERALLGFALTAQERAELTDRVGMFPYHVTNVAHTWEAEESATGGAEIFDGEAERPDHSALFFVQPSVTAPFHTSVLDYEPHEIGDTPEGSTGSQGRGPGAIEAPPAPTLHHHEDVGLPHSRTVTYAPVVISFIGLAIAALSLFVAFSRGDASFSPFQGRELNVVSRRLDALCQNAASVSGFSADPCMQRNVEPEATTDPTPRDSTAPSSHRVADGRVIPRPESESARQSRDGDKSSIGGVGGTVIEPERERADKDDGKDDESNPIDDKDSGTGYDKGSGTDEKSSDESSGSDPAEK